MSTARKVFWVAVFSVAMAFVEAVVVVYLRRIFYPDGFVFPLRVLDLSDSGGWLLLVETCRELATLVMLTAVAVLSGQSWVDRWAYFLLAFAGNTGKHRGYNRRYNDK